MGRKRKRGQARTHKGRTDPVALPRIPTEFELEYERLRQMYETGLLSPEYAQRVHDLLRQIDERLPT